MTPTYENRGQAADGETVARVFTTRDAAIDDIVRLIERGRGDYDYDGTLVVHRDSLGRPIRADILDLIPAAREWIRDSADDPPVRSIKHMETWGRLPA